MLFLCDGQTLLLNESTTQGDPLAMAMYTFGTHPPICKLHKVAKQVWYAGDFAAGSPVENLKKCWDLMYEIGPKYRYYPNSSKIHLLVKQDAKTVFRDTGIHITTDGCRYLDNVLVNAAFLKLFTNPNSPAGSSNCQLFQLSPRLNHTHHILHLLMVYLNY